LGREVGLEIGALAEPEGLAFAKHRWVVLVPHSGHISTLEQPTAVIDAVLRWIGKVDKTLES
jgi:hypothetical protein